MFREAGELAEQRRAEIEAAMAEAINAETKSEEGIVMSSSSWVISATNPEA